MMVRFEPPRFIALAVIIWVVWRFIIWRRKGADPAREAVVLALFLWCLLAFYFTFFPMGIVLYSWYGTFNLVPFASITQLIRDTSPGLASYNIVGNLLLLAPLGILLPLLFKKLQHLWPLAWRVGAISALIEASQLVTRARAVDIDDVILNTAGATLAFGLYLLLRLLVERRPKGEALLNRIGIVSSREPLLLSAVPVGLTALTAISIMLSTLFGATLSDGDAGIVAHAKSMAPDGTVTLVTEVNDYAFVMLESTERDELDLYLYKKVLPGRYTPSQYGSYPRFKASGYSWGITAYNTEVGELPIIYIWGLNEVGATEVVVDGNGVHVELPLPDQPYFAVGFYLESAVNEVFDTLTYRFVNADGRDVTGQFDSPDP